MSGPEGSFAALRWRHPSEISRTANVLWNTPATLLQALLPFVFIPIYLQLLGAPAYGLLVLNATILAALLFLDRLVAPAVIREFGRRNGDPAAAGFMRDLLRSFEVVAIAVGLAVAVGVVLGAPALTDGWAGQSHLDADVLRRAFLLMAVSMLLQWPGFLYAAGLVGLQRQALHSGIRVAGALALHAGGAAALLIGEPDVLKLLAWQAVAQGLTTLALGLANWRVMPPGERAARFSASALRSVWRMALGSLLIGVTASLLTQLDKFLVARFAPPDLFAAYGLAFMAASAVFSVLTAPLGAAMQPHFARLLDAGDRHEAADAYHRFAQVLALFAAPVAGILVFFPEAPVDLWLGAASPVSPMVKAVLPATATAVLLMTLIGPPTVLQLAAGWNGLILACHSASILVALLALPPLLARYGIVAGAWFNAGLTAAYFVAMAAPALRRLLPGAYGRWLLLDVLLPLAVAGLTFGLLRHAAGAGPSLPSAIALGLGGAVLAFGALVALLPDGRRQLVQSSRFLLRR